MTMVYNVARAINNDLIHRGFITHHGYTNHIKVNGGIGTAKGCLLFSILFLDDIVVINRNNSTFRISYDVLSVDAILEVLEITL